MITANDVLNKLEKLDSKKGSGPDLDRLVNNYRPISKLSCAGKIFESLITDLIVYIYKSDIIPQQHGFLEGRSTVTNLFNCKDYILSAFESGNEVYPIYTDFEKVFDRVVHNYLW